MDEIRRLKSLLVKHEKRIRALEARAAAADGIGVTGSPPSANSSSILASPGDLSSSPSTAAAPTTQSGENNHVTHDTNANLAKPSGTSEEMAPDEV